jgi:hypothetical protein
LRIVFAGEVDADAHHFKIFQYQADAEDGICGFDHIVDFGFAEFHRPKVLPCYGEVWTDEDMHILRISQHLELTGRWHNWKEVVTFGWVDTTIGSSRLLPVTISAQAQYRNTIHWCNGRFMNYHTFSATSRIIPE